MSPTEFVLAPFPGLPAPEGVRITGAAWREGATLDLSWRLEAPAGSLVIAPPATPAERRPGLWEDSCFEFFLASPAHPGYREFNLSPAGHWNVFRFEAYRAGMADETAFDALPFSVSNRSDMCEVSLRLDTSALGLAAAPWSLAVSTVITEPGGRVTYWALVHPDAQPDFHHPAAFALRL